MEGVTGIQTEDLGALITIWSPLQGLSSKEVMVQAVPDNKNNNIAIFIQVSLLSKVGWLLSININGEPVYLKQLKSHFVQIYTFKQVCSSNKMLKANLAFLESHFYRPLRRAFHLRTFYAVWKQIRKTRRNTGENNEIIKITLNHKKIK